jgi:polysaccharide pyruvyl transferase WcaK-like protein
MNILKEPKRNQEENGKANSKLPIKIGLMGNSGCGNFGETATQQAIIENIRRYYPDADIHSFAPNPEAAQRELSIPSFPTISCEGIGWWEGGEGSPLMRKTINFLNRLRKNLPSSALRKIPTEVLELIAWVRAYNHLKNFDILIVSGGGQLDDYCFGGRWGYPFTLLMWGFLARLSKTKYYIVSVGAGPLDSWKSRVFIKGALWLTQYRSYRDKGSKQYVREIVGFLKDDPVYPDLAHSLQIKAYQQIVERGKSRQVEDNRLVVGINPYMGLIMTGAATDLKPPYPCIGEGSLYLEYLDKLASFVSWLIQNQYKIVFLASETHKGCHDCHQISRDIKDILDKAGLIYSQEQITESSAQSLDDLMIQISELDLVVASRFHCILLSQLIDKPVLALSFNSKIDLLMVDRGQADYCLQIDKFDAETLKKRFSTLAANREIIKQQLAERTQEYREALNEQYERLFGSLKGTGLLRGGGSLTP